MVAQFQANMDNIQEISQGEVHDQFYGIMTQLMDEYNTEDNFDKLKSVEHKLKIGERKIKNAIVEALANTEQMEETNEKAERLNKEAEDYNDGAKEIKTTMGLRNTKLTLILGIIAVAVVITIVLMVFKK